LPVSPAAKRGASSVNDDMSSYRKFTDILQTEFPSSTEMEKRKKDPLAKVAKVAKVVEANSLHPQTFATSATLATRPNFNFYFGRQSDSASGLTRLDPANPPAGVPLYRWQMFVDDCRRFVASSLAKQATALGWTVLDLFGVDIDRPLARIDRMGLLWLLEGREIVALTASEAIIRTPSEATLRYQRTPEQDGQALAWDVVESEKRKKSPLAKVAKVAKVSDERPPTAPTFAASATLATPPNSNSRFGGHVCAQCNAPGGTLSQVTAHKINGALVWLHPECAKFYRRPT
jgi:hypothetical protein